MVLVQIFHLDFLRTKDDDFFSNLLVFGNTAFPLLVVDDNVVMAGAVLGQGRVLALSDGSYLTDFTCKSHVQWWGNM